MKPIIQDQGIEIKVNPWGESHIVEYTLFGRFTIGWKVSNVAVTYDSIAVSNDDIELIIDYYVENHLKPTDKVLFKSYREDIPLAHLFICFFVLKLSVKDTLQIMKLDRAQKPDDVMEEVKEYIDRYQQAFRKIIEENTQ